MSDLIKYKCILSSTTYYIIIIFRDLTASITINCKLDAANNFASLDPHSFTCPLFPDSFIPIYFLIIKYIPPFHRKKFFN